MFCSLADGSRRSYNTGARSYLKFCSNFGVPEPMPAHEGDLCLFVVFLARSCKHSTIRNYLFGVRSWHVELGFPDPIADKLMLRKMERGVKRIQGEADKKPKFPITLALLELLAQRLNWKWHDQVMLFAAWCVACGALLRVSEFTSFSSNAAPLLLNRDFSPTKEDGGYMYKLLHLGASKADPFRRGVDIVVGHSHSVANALNAFARYDSMRSPEARRPDAPLFSFVNGSPLSKDACLASLRLAIVGLNMDTSRFSAFSFRRGGAQSLRDAGVPDHLIQVIGRWASDAYKLYLTTAPRHIAALASRASLFTKLPVCIAGPVWSPAL
jgi:hypothetical protein